MSQITNICQVPFYSQSGAASPWGSKWLRLRWLFARGQSGAVPTKAWIHEVSSTHRTWTRPSARQHEISNHFSDTKATGISCLSVGEGLWGKTQEVRVTLQEVNLWIHRMQSNWLHFYIRYNILLDSKPPIIDSKIIIGEQCLFLITLLFFMLHTLQGLIMSLVSFKRQNQHSTTVTYTNRMTETCTGWRSMSAWDGCAAKKWKILNFFAVLFLNLWKTSYKNLAIPV